MYDGQLAAERRYCLELRRQHHKLGAGAGEYILYRDGTVGGRSDSGRRRTCPGSRRASLAANIFDPSTETWTVAPDMSYPRWYPTVTALSDGTQIVTSGETNCDECDETIQEIYNPVDQFLDVSLAVRRSSSRTTRTFTSCRTVESWCLQTPKLPLPVRCSISTH